jgi:hypothetical protein
VTAYLYPGGRAAWFDTWVDDSLVWLLLNGTAVYDPSIGSIAELVPSEVSVAGYNRLPLSDPYMNTPTTTETVWGGTGPHWTALTSGDQIGALVLADETVDRPLAFWLLTPQLDSGTGDLEFVFGLMWSDPAAPPGTQLIQRWTSGG